MNIRIFLNLSLPWKRMGWPFYSALVGLVSALDLMTLSCWSLIPHSVIGAPCLPQWVIAPESANTFAQLSNQPSIPMHRVSEVIDVLTLDGSGPMIYQRIELTFSRSSGPPVQKNVWLLGLPNPSFQACGFPTDVILSTQLYRSLGQNFSTMESLQLSMPFSTELLSFTAGEPVEMGPTNMVIMPFSGAQSLAGWEGWATFVGILNTPSANLPKQLHLFNPPLKLYAFGDLVKASNSEKPKITLPTLACICLCVWALLACSLIDSRSRGLILLRQYQAAHYLPLLALLETTIIALPALTLASFILFLSPDTAEASPWSVVWRSHAAVVCTSFSISLLAAAFSTSKWSA